MSTKTWPYIVTGSSRSVALNQVQSLPTDFSNNSKARQKKLFVHDGWSVYGRGVFICLGQWLDGEYLKYLFDFKLLYFEQLLFVDFFITFIQISKENLHFFLGSFLLPYPSSKRAEFCQSVSLHGQEDY